MTSERNPRRFYESKKEEKAFPWKPNTEPMKMPDQVQSDSGGKAKPLGSVTHDNRNCRKTYISK